MDPEDKDAFSEMLQKEEEGVEQQPQQPLQAQPQQPFAAQPQQPLQQAQPLQQGQQFDPAQNATILNRTINTTWNGTVTTIYYDKDYSHVATAIGVMLLGMVTFTMTLFYATHFPDSEVQHATWLTLSESVSLMLAVLCFTSFKDLMVLQFGETGGHHNQPPDIKSLVISFIRLFFAYAGVHVMLMKYRHTVVPLKAWGSIGGNVVAFAAIDAFGMIQQFKPFNANPANCFLGMCIAGFMILCMCFSAHLVRNWVMTYEDGTIKEHERNWDDQCRSVENQFAAISLGLLLSVVIRYAISGSLPAVHGSPMYKTSTQVWILFGVTLGFALPVFGMALTVNALANLARGLPSIVRAAKVTSLVVAMCMGWSFVFWAQWAFYSATDNQGVGMGDRMTARFCDALFMSYLGFVFIIGLDFMADKMQVARGGFRALQTALVLAIGISWQGAFSEAVGAMSYKFQDKRLRAYMDALMTILLCSIITPAWIWYMLPKALAGPVKLEPLLPPKQEVDPKEQEGEKDETAKDEAAEGEASKGDVCHNCGTPYEEEDSEFCQNCGVKRLPKEPAETKAPAETKSAPAETNEGEAAKEKGTLGAYSKSREVKKPAADTPTAPAAPTSPAAPTPTAPISTQLVESEESDANRLTSGAYSSNRGQPRSTTASGGGKADASGGKGRGRQSTGKAQPQQVTAAPWDQPEGDGSGEDQHDSYQDGDAF